MFKNKWRLFLDFTGAAASPLTNVLSLNCPDQPYLGLLPILSALQSRSSISALEGLGYVVRRVGTALPPVTLTCWLNFLEDPRTIHSLTSSPASFCFWLNFLDGPWTQLVISPCLMVTGQLMEQAVTNLPCSGTVGLCPPWSVKSLPLPVWWSPWAPGLYSFMELPRSCCSLIENFCRDFSNAFGPFCYMCYMTTWIDSGKKKPKKVVFLLCLLNINIYSSGCNKEEP